MNLPKFSLGLSLFSVVFSVAVLIFILAGCNDSNTAANETCPLECPAIQYNEGRTDVLKDYAGNLKRRMNSWERTLGHDKKACNEIEWVFNEYTAYRHSLTQFGYYVAPQDKQVDKTFDALKKRILKLRDELIYPRYKTCVLEK